MGTCKIVTNYFFSGRFAIFFSIAKWYRYKHVFLLFRADETMVMNGMGGNTCEVVGMGRTPNYNALKKRPRAMRSPPSGAGAASKTNTAPAPNTRRGRRQARQQRRMQGRGRQAGQSSQSGQTATRPMQKQSNVGGHGAGSSGSGHHTNSFGSSSEASPPEIDRRSRYLPQSRPGSRPRASHSTNINGGKSNVKAPPRRGRVGGNRARSKSYTIGDLAAFPFRLGAAAASATVKGAKYSVRIVARPMRS